jgi:hypothetical protein
MLKCLLKRGETSDRTDDNAKTIEKRFGLSYSSVHILHFVDVTIQTLPMVKLSLLLSITRHKGKSLRYVKQSIIHALLMELALH